MESLFFSRRAKASDSEACFEICCATGNGGEDARDICKQDPQCLGRIYTQPYLEFSIVSAGRSGVSPRSRNAKITLAARASGHLLRADRSTWRLWLYTWSSRYEGILRVDAYTVPAKASGEVPAARRWSTAELECRGRGVRAVLHVAAPLSRSI